MSKHRDIDFFKNPAAEREWQAQERAMHAARTGEPAVDDARTRAYRQIDAALRADDAIALPADFADQLAAIAGPVPTAAAPETGFEKQLTRLLLATLVIAGLVVAALEGGSWFHADPAAWSVAGNPWVLALLACLGASQGAEWLRRKLG